MMPGHQHADGCDSHVVASEERSIGVLRPARGRPVRVELSAPPDSTVHALQSATDLGEFIEVDHCDFSRTDANLIRIAHSRTEFRPLMEWLAVHGWLVYKSSSSASTLVRQSHIPRLWHRVRSGELSVSASGLIHRLESDGSTEPHIPPSALVVIFSSMAAPYDAPGLSRHFYRNFSSALKHLPAGTAVLRIADLDGVVGGFYLPSTFDPQRSAKVRALIAETAQTLGIAEDRVILYGASKGGTAALYHGLTAPAAWRSVAVDPVVDDRYYEETYGDSHWTSGSVFPSRKTDLFASAAAEARTYGSEPPRLAVVTSEGSPLFPSIDGLISSFDPGALLYIRSEDPRITDHPDVSAQTLRTVTGILSVWVSGIELCAGRTIVTPAG